MCLTIPKQITSAKNGFFVVKSAKGRQEVGSFVKVKKGDWVLTQNNVIVRKISQKEAKEISDLFKKGGK